MAVNFWEKLPHPIYALAPLAGVTDSAFRRVCKAHGADVVYSEMASATALVHNPAKTLELLAFQAEERPYVVQLFGSEPEHFARAAAIVESELRPDGFDVNFGCPAPKVVKQGAGSALMQDLKRSRAVLESLLAATKLPISVKLRAGCGKITALDFLKETSDLDIKAVMIHGRTLAQGFNGPIDTALIKAARSYCSGVLLVNGGIDTPEDIKLVLEETGADGVGIARGALGNPWIFERPARPEPRTLSEIKTAAKQQAVWAFEQKSYTGIIEMRKHLCWYVKNFPGAKSWREKLVKVETLEDIDKIFKD
jgi:nifR3 family TIM-barrel protein